MELLDWIVISVFCLALIGIVLWVVSQKNDNSTHSSSSYRTTRCITC